MVFVLLSLALVGWLWTSPALAIPYDSTEYYASVYAVYNWTEVDQDDSGLPWPNYPDDRFAEVTNASARAISEGSYAGGDEYPATRLLAETSAQGDEGDNTAYSESSMNYWASFTADFPAVKLYFDYDYRISGSGEIYTTGVIVYTYLRDVDTGSFVWEDYYDFYYGDETTVYTGTINEEIILISGHQYELGLELYNQAYAYLDGESALAFAEITNLSLDAVPLPSTLLLLGTGLLGLGALGWRRK
jgi:hypothetical protein